MDAYLINRLLSSTGTVLAETIRGHITPGRPFSREAAMTPYEYSALLTVRQEETRSLELMVSVPAYTASALAEGDESVDARLAAVAALTRQIAQAAVGHLDVEGVEISPPRGVVGWDVTVPELRQTARRICVPFSGPAGSLLVEAGVHG